MGWKFVESLFQQPILSYAAEILAYREEYTLIRVVNADRKQLYFLYGLNPNKKITLVSKILIFIILHI